MKKAIICVDDEKIILDSLKKELKPVFGSDYVIETCESGMDAIDLINELLESNYDIPLIIADYIMPGMKGDEVLMNVYKTLPNIKTIMLTGQATMDGVTSAVNKANLYRYISKPWQTEDLVMTIREAIKMYDTERQLEERRKELEIANRKLTALDRSKTYFIMLLAHELNTPLQSIDGFTEVLKSSLDDEELIHYCDIIDNSSKRLKRFSDYSLLIVELLNERYKLNKMEYDLISLLNMVINKYASELNNKNITIEKKFSVDSLNLVYDLKLIRKVLEIIVENAVKFSNDGSTIEINGTGTDDKYIISIKDEGPGFESDALENLFKFFVSDNIMFHSVGYGLGLATAKLIMDAHKYSIVVENYEKGVIVKLIFNINTPVE
jgi:two-component system, sensor histidine kinase and response regulator